jgi:hypothetical protein
MAPGTTPPIVASLFVMMEAEGSGGNARASRVRKGESSAREASLDFCPNPSTDLGFFIDDSRESHATDRQIRPPDT